MVLLEFVLKFFRSDHLVMPILDHDFSGFRLLFHFDLLRDLSAVRSLLGNVQEVAKHLLLDCLNMELRGVTLDDFVAGELL